METLSVPSLSIANQDIQNPGGRRLVVGLLDSSIQASPYPQDTMIARLCVSIDYERFPVVSGTVKKYYFGIWLV